ncbi:hypothetical protein [Nostoc sp.]|uniref:hypothetical protein n=1 Tax=Nostoc sp. TaxID=1180 RepID=UPI002FF56ECB
MGENIRDSLYLLANKIKSEHQIITVNLLNLSLPLGRMSGDYDNMFKSINKIKYRLLSYGFDKDQYKNYMFGGIYQ